MNVQPSNPNNPIVFFDVTIGGQVSLNPANVTVLMKLADKLTDTKLHSRFLNLWVAYLNRKNSIWGIRVQAVNLAKMLMVSTLLLYYEVSLYLKTSGPKIEMLDALTFSLLIWVVTSV